MKKQEAKDLIKILDIIESDNKKLRKKLQKILEKNTK